MLDIILDTLLDALKLIPFLFLTYFLMEFIEHKMGEKTEKVIHRSGRLGPLFGSLCGCVPQCGFSAAASNFYACRVITLGTLISVYLSTSDEMLPIMISERAGAGLIFTVIGIKIFYGMLIGFAVDLIYRRKDEAPRIHELCEHEKCHCENNIFLPALRHTGEIILYIVIISFVLNTVIYYVGEESIKSIILNKPVLGEAISGVLGLVPNCAASVIITELYLEGMINFGSLMAGLFVGAGVGLLILFKVNRSKKECFAVLGVLYAAGVIGGIIINLLGISV